MSHESVDDPAVRVEEAARNILRTAAASLDVQVGRQRLSSAQSPRSWATFSPSMHQEGMLNGEIIVLEDEVDRVLSAALGAGLQVTALSFASIFAQPRLLTMSVFGDGRFQDLAGAFRRTLDEIGR